MAGAEIRSEAELRDLLGMPGGRAVTKERTRLHAVDREWLAISPFCVLATSDADGNCDASPKGDPAGHLVHVIDETTIAIAERASDLVLGRDPLPPYDPPGPERAGRYQVSPSRQSQVRAPVRSSSTETGST